MFDPSSIIKNVLGPFCSHLSGVNTGLSKLSIVADPVDGSLQFIIKDILRNNQFGVKVIDKEDEISILFSLYNQPKHDEITEWEEITSLSKSTPEPGINCYKLLLNCLISATHTHFTFKKLATQLKRSHS